MRAAPAVSVPCSRGGAWRVCQVLMAALAAGTAAAWALGHLHQPLWPAASAGLVAGMSAGWLAKAGVVRLAWDGRQWTADGSPGELAVMLDLGPWLLLRLRPSAGSATQWLPVSAGEAGPNFHALRAALYAQPSDTRDGARPVPRHATEAD